MTDETLRPTSVCSPFAIDWYIDENESQNTIITINTGESNTFLFDLAIAEFITEDGLPVSYETQYDLPNGLPAQPLQSLITENTPVGIWAVSCETQSELSIDLTPQTQQSPIVLFVFTGSAFASLGVGAFFLVKHNKKTTRLENTRCGRLSAIYHLLPQHTGLRNR